MMQVETINRIEIERHDGRRYSISFSRTGGGDVVGITARRMEEKEYGGKKYWDDTERIGEIEFD